MKRTIAAAFAAAALLCSQAFAFDHPVMLAGQGSFAAGGTTVTTPGQYDYAHPLTTGGQTLHGDHAYVFWQKPVNAHTYPLVFLHGAGQSGQSWETTPDGRDGFQNIFLEKGFATYIVDQPRRGRAGRSTLPETISAKPDDQLWFNNFRMGHWPDYYDNVALSKNPKALEQFFRQMTPNTGAYNDQVISDAMAAVFEKSGDAVLVTHSQGGGPGWLTAIKSDKVKGIIAIEPGSGFVFPEGEVPAPLETTSPFGALKGAAIPASDFAKLTRMPIVIYFGDNIPETPTDEWGLDNWRVRLQMARLFAETVNRHGGHAEVVKLPDEGLKGNTHFLFSDTNNKEVADLIARWLHKEGLDK